jgi:hypothetical protein
VGPDTASAVTDASGVADLPITSLVGATEFEIVAYIDCLPPDVWDLGTAGIRFAVLPPDLHKERSNFTVSTGPKAANGVEEHTVTVHLANRVGGAVPGMAGALAFDATGQANAKGPFAEVSGQPGTYVAVLTTTKAGDKKVTVTLDTSSGTVPVPGP